MGVKGSRRRAHVNHNHSNKDESGSAAPTEESSIRSSLSSEINSTASGFPPASGKDSSISSGHDLVEAAQQSSSNPQKSTHSRDATINSISTAELKKTMTRRRRSKNQNNASANAGNSNTTSGQADLFTIGQANFSVDLFNSSTKQLEGNMSSMGLSSGGFSNTSNFGNSLQESFSVEHGQNSSKTPFSMRTPFEVDAPRDPPVRPSPRNSLSDALSIVSERTNPLLSEEQDAWAGIDELLETKSLDDSFTFSTSDILPQKTVDAMRRGHGFKWTDEETVVDDDHRSVSGESRASIPPLPVTTRKIPQGRSAAHNASSRGQNFGMGQDSWNASEANDFLCALPGPTSEAGLFGMFQWSEKDNVDSQRIRKGKLNSRAKKLASLQVGKSSTHDSETSSLPSLSSFRPDDLSVRSGRSTIGPDTMHSEMGSVVSENSRDEFGFEVVDDKHVHVDRSMNSRSIDSPTSNGDDMEDDVSESMASRNSLASDGLVLDKGVDEYIRQIQQQLPTISEDGKGRKRGGKRAVGFSNDQPSSPSPTSVVREETAFDELPSLSDVSGTTKVQIPRGVISKSRKEEKKDNKSASSSISYLMNSFRKIGKTKPQKGKTRGNEGKFFPEEVKKDKSKKYSANRCLLSEGADGVNWDAD